MGEQRKINIKVEGPGESKSREEERAGALEEHKPFEPVPVGEAKEAAEAKKGAEAAEGPLEKAQRESVENRDRWMRSVAELENFKKRTMQEKSRILKYRNEDLLRDLLPVKDNLERAMNYCDETGRSSNGVAEGVCMIARIFDDIFQRYGVQKIEALGKPFNPQYHEAIASVPAAGKAPNTVVEELEHGYTYQDKLLRPAKVVVSSSPAQGQED